MSTGELPDARSSDAAADEAALRRELDEVRDGIVECWGEMEDDSGREILWMLLGALPAFVALIFVAVFLFPADGDTRQDNLPLLVASVPLLAFAAFCMRGKIRRWVGGRRKVRGLRAREREIVALLPAGPNGPTAYRRWVDSKFGHPVLMALLASAMFMVFVLPILLRRF